jgi:branched-chain amino acid transport system ATP-binding protein
MLALEKIEVNYGAASALKGISLEVAEGQCVCMIGANGAGKTTTLKTISGVVKAVGGIVKFNGQEIQKLRPDQVIKLGIAHCPEGRRVFPAMSVLENLEMGAFLNRSQIPERMEYCFQLFPRLKERIGQMAGTLSGGEQQMLAIARALMSNPKIVMFDEPSLGLAPKIVEQVGDIIQELHKSGLTVLLVEQNAYLAMSISDYTYVLENGKIEKHGKSIELLHDDYIRKAYLGI